MEDEQHQGVHRSAAVSVEIRQAAPADRDSGTRIALLSEIGRPLGDQFRRKLRFVLGPREPVFLEGKVCGFRLKFINEFDC